jgi:hypothetical protein
LGGAAAELLRLVPATARVVLAPQLQGVEGEEEEEGAKAVADGRGEAAAVTPAAAVCEGAPDGAPATALASSASSGLLDIRRLAAQAVAMCCDALGCGAMEALLELLPHAAHPTAPPGTQLGAALCMRAIISTLQTRVLPYAALLITPLVASLAHSSACIRHEASAAFGQLMPLLPLEPGTADPTDMSAALRARKAAERPCVDQLLGVVVGGAPPRYELPMVLKTTLRPYQQAGVDWLAFLRRFGLHGILCDDMGLGKTLQTLCVLAAAAHEQRARRAGASERLGCGGGGGSGGSGGSGGGCGSGNGNGSGTGSSGNWRRHLPPSEPPFHRRLPGHPHRALARRGDQILWLRWALCA